MRYFKGHRSGVEGAVLYEKRRKDSGRQRTGGRGMGKKMGQEPTEALFNAVMKPYTWYADF